MSLTDLRQRIASLHAEGMSQREISEQVGLARSWVCNHCADMGLKANHNRRWTTTEQRFLAGNPHLPAKEAGRMLGRSEMAVLTRRSRLGIKRKRPESVDYGKNAGGCQL